MIIFNSNVAIQVIIMILIKQLKFKVFSCSTFYVMINRKFQLCDCLEYCKGLYEKR